MQGPLTPAAQQHCQLATPTSLVGVQSFTAVVAVTNRAVVPVGLQDSSCACCINSRLANVEQ